MMVFECVVCCVMCRVRHSCLNAVLTDCSLMPVCLDNPRMDTNIWPLVITNP